MEQLELKDIDMNVDYERLNFYISHIAHEVKRLGRDGFVEKYSELIMQNQINKKWKLLIQKQ